MTKQKFSFSIAFTLAEVLITLGIIGIVASMTIPSLISKTQNAELVTGLNVFYYFSSNRTGTTR